MTMTGSLEGSGVEHQSGGGVTASPNCLGSVCEEVQYQVAECGTQAQSAKLVSFMGEIVLKPPNNSMMLLYSRCVNNEDSSLLFSFLPSNCTHCDKVILFTRHLLHVCPSWERDPSSGALPDGFSHFFSLLAWRCGVSGWVREWRRGKFSGEVIRS